MEFYPEFTHEPSKPHQCVHYNSEGIQCRSYAMHNQYVCYHHMNTAGPSVISNDAFPLEAPKDRASIQNAIADVLVRLAENQMDIKRAGMLLYGLQIAVCNLPPPAHRRGSSSRSHPLPIVDSTADVPKQAVLNTLEASQSDGISPHISALPTATYKLKIS